MPENRRKLPFCRTFKSNGADSSASPPHALQPVRARRLAPSPMLPVKLYSHCAKRSNFRLKARAILTTFRQLGSLTCPVSIWESRLLEMPVRFSNWRKVNPLHSRATVINSPNFMAFSPMLPVKL